MIGPERRDRILSEVARRGAASVRDLAQFLNVSEATIRRDLEDLSREGLLRRTHGGATVAEPSDEVPYRFKVTAYMAEKRRIGATAASMLRKGQVLGCTGGTTIAQVARAIRGGPLTIVTNAVNIGAELVATPEVEVVLTGGVLRSRSYELIGPVAERTIHDFYLDVALIGVDGLSVEQGLTTFSHAEAYINRTFMKQAKETWVVADHSKLGRITAARIAPIEELDCLITDSEAPPEFVEQLRGRGVRVVLA